MSDLSDKIERDYIEAYKAKDTEKVAVLRMLKAAIKNKQVDLGREPDDAEVRGILTTQLKQRRESFEQYEAAGRDDLAEKELRETRIIEIYLPPPMSDDELQRLVDQAVRDLGAADMKDMGRVMQKIMPECKGRVDGKKVSEAVRAKLS
jgi:hypothetical protein